MHVRADFVHGVEAAHGVAVEIAGVDLGIANLFALHSTSGRRSKMSQGEFRALAKLDSYEQQSAEWCRRAQLPTLPDIRRPVARVLFRHLAVLHHYKKKFQEEYSSMHRLHARLTVSADTRALHTRERP